MSIEVKLTNDVFLRFLQIRTVFTALKFQIEEKSPAARMDAT